MRSPFPGMDPYLEEPGGWGGVHDALIALLCEHLNRQLGSGYIADGDTRDYIVSPDEQRWIFPDVYIIETPTPAARSAGMGAIAAPVRVSLAEPAAIRQPYILIRDRANRQVVNVIELLSPINKTPTPPPGHRRGPVRALQVRRVARLRAGTAPAGLLPGQRSVGGGAGAARAGDACRQGRVVARAGRLPMRPA